MQPRETPFTRAASKIAPLTVLLLLAGYFLVNLPPLDWISCNVPTIGSELEVRMALPTEHKAVAYFVNWCVGLSYMHEIVGIKNAILGPFTEGITIHRTFLRIN